MIQINNENVIDYILYNFNLSTIEELKEEQLNQLETLAIDGEGYENERLDYLIMFTNLKSIIIKNININKQNFEKILSLNKLEKIDFINCKITENVKLCKQIIKEISFISCTNIYAINFASNLEKLSIKGGKKVDLTRMEEVTNLHTLFLQDLKIKNLEFIEKLPKLKYLNLTGSSIKENQKYLLENEKIKIEYEKQSYYII